MLNVLSVAFLLLIGGFTVVSDVLFSPNSPVLNTELATKPLMVRRKFGV